ncbi:MAG: hypothetical protein ACLU8F_01180 [Clostridia bacterium]
MTGRSTNIKTKSEVSKAGIIGFTKSMEKELATGNTLVNAVVPGTVLNVYGGMIMIKIRYIVKKTLKRVYTKGKACYTIYPKPFE